MTYTEPLLILCSAVALVGLLNIRRGRSRYLAYCGILALLLVSWPPVDWLLAQPLVGWYPVREFQPPAGIQAIVVLGSAVSPPHYERPYPLADSETFRRCEHAAWIYRRGTQVPVLACEGHQERGAFIMGELLRRAGVPVERIWVENQSLSTHENAVYGSRILGEHGIHRIVLVVDGPSMIRAAACFRKLGIDVVPAPSSFR